ncbi:33751_t:CDS:1, partial [Racocetra persica]
VLLLVRIVLEDTLTFDLALIRWYDFKHPNATLKFYKYRCPYLQFTNIYNM